MAKELLEEVAKYGTATVKRAYGDWTTQHLTGWKNHLHKHAIQPIGDPPEGGRQKGLWSGRT
nr:NYN domain-containing protein [Pseudomonas caricapapayae]